MRWWRCRIIRTTRPRVKAVPLHAASRPFRSRARGRSKEKVTHFPVIGWKMGCYGRSKPSDEARGVGQGFYSDNPFSYQDRNPDLRQDLLTLRGLGRRMYTIRD